MVKQCEEKSRRFNCTVNVVILDDELAFAEMLDKQIEIHCIKKDWLYESQIYTSGRELLEKDLSRVQIVFLDIDMPEQSGLDIAKILREHYPELILVFVTAFIEYAPAGYKVDAFRYLLKPQLGEDLPCCMDSIQEKLYESKSCVLVRLKNRIEKVSIKSILYVEGTSQRRVHIFLTTGDLLECLGKLEEYDELLSGNGFVRLQKSFLANMQYIDRIASYNAYLQNGMAIKVSEKNYKEICKKFLLWKGTHL